MRKTFLFLTFILFSSISSAEVYLIYNDSNKEVKSISQRDDAVLEEGYSKVVLQGEIQDYPLAYSEKYYKFENNRFVVNTQKLSDEENVKQDNENKDIELEMVYKKSLKTACKQLEKEGTQFKKISCDDL